MFSDLDENLKQCILTKYGKLKVPGKVCTEDNINTHIADFYRVNNNFVEIEETLQEQDIIGIYKMLSLGISLVISFRISQRVLSGLAVYS